ncbi:hypothetical protein DF185_11225 [Marinifilum breve]|uniref:Uncharacterized protein n=1 Tax=Marinifilum breve TaxID=2184082 RepID=A0A2V3ZXN5_9BACT|nr:hypothetical protein [Marinifilum breve]PXY01209.1 hypothetical protein DF185_11225 [Marinifilum breve]
MKQALILLLLFAVHGDLYSQYFEKSKMDWWDNNNADSIENNWLKRKHLIKLEKDSFYFHYPDTLTLIEKGKFIFPRKHYLSVRDYEDSYLSDLELTIMSRTLAKQGMRRLYEIDGDFVRLLSFKEKNPIVTDYFFNSDSLTYTITNGFSWTHGDVIDSGGVIISTEKTKRIYNELHTWIDNDWQIYRSSELTDFIIEFKLENEYGLIKLSRLDYKNKMNRPYIKLIKEFEKIIGMPLLEKRN